MPTPSQHARAALDEYISTLTSLTDGLTLDDFRTAQIERARQTTKRVKIYIVICSFVFLFLSFASFFLFVKYDTQNHSYDMLFAMIWAVALGGLGAVASIFLHVLKLVPQSMLKSNDEFEVVGRIVLGCLFSAIFAATIDASPIVIFFNSLHNLDCSTPTSPKCKIDGGPMLLLPFLAGYSITLVLGLLEKAIRAVELTIGLEDRRETVGRRKPSRNR